MKKYFGKLILPVGVIIAVLLGSSCAEKASANTVSTEEDSSVEADAAEAVSKETEDDSTSGEGDEFYPTSLKDYLAALEKEGNAAVRDDGRFAPYVNYQYKGQPRVPPYTVEAGLANIVNLNQFTDTEYYYYVTQLSDEAKKKIQENGFVVDDSASRREYFGVYEENRYWHAPSFITTDSATHTFHLMFDYVLKNLEQEKLAGVLKKLSMAMVLASLAQYDEVKGTDFENAAKRNVAFFSVGAKLIDSHYPVPELVESIVAEELALIEAHKGPEESPLLNRGETFASSIELQQMDYSQFIPRGHYTQTDTLKRYFKAQKWYGLATFRSAYEDEVKSALLQTAALNRRVLKNLWQTLFEPISFFVGECDDITYNQYSEALSRVYGDGFTDLAAVRDAAKFATALKLIGTLPPPRINSIPVYNAVLQPDRDKAITGYRFLGDRFTIDASIFQRLIDRETEGRFLPKALDIPAAFGSALAVSILQDNKEMDEYPEYGPNLKEVQDYVKSLDTDTWTSNLYWAWLYMLRQFAENAGKTGLPAFMQNAAWDAKALNTFLGSWTELKHDTLLYAKQSMAEKGGGRDEPPPPPDDRGYVEPNPVVFGRLASLVDMTINGLQSRGLLTAEAKESLGILLDIAHQLTVIAEKELSNTPLTSAEYDAIRNYGGELEHIWRTAKKDEMKGVDRDTYLYQHPDAVVADVATDPNGSVLEEATGYAKEIYVAFPREGKVVLGRGVVYSQYEFTVPISERMTDEAWHERLNNNDVPAVADWKKVYMANVRK